MQRTTTDQFRGPALSGREAVCTIPPAVYYPKGCPQRAHLSLLSGTRQCTVVQIPFQSVREKVDGNGRRGGLTADGMYVCTHVLDYNTIRERPAQKWDGRCHSFRPFPSKAWASDAIRGPVRALVLLRRRVGVPCPAPPNETSQHPPRDLAEFVAYQWTNGKRELVFPSHTTTVAPPNSHSQRDHLPGAARATPFSPPLLISAFRRLGTISS